MGMMSPLIEQDDAREGGEWQQYVDESHGIDHTCREVAQVASQEITLQWYRRVVGAAVHQIADEQSVEDEEHEILHPLLACEHEGEDE